MNLDCVRDDLLHCFMALFGRRVMSHARLYMYHHGEESMEDFNAALIRALKYHSLSPDGMARQIQPFVTLVLAQGYLTPEQFEDNALAQRAVQLYTSRARLNQNMGADWMTRYIFGMLADSDAFANEIVAEAAELGNVLDANAQSEEQEEEEDDDDSAMWETGECPCDFCKVLRVYDDVDLDTVHASDPLERIVVSGLQAALLPKI